MIVRTNDTDPTVSGPDIFKIITRTFDIKTTINPYKIVSILGINVAK